MVVRIGSPEREAALKRLFVLAGIIILAGFLPAGAPETPGKPGIVKSYAKLPLRFEANLGQTDSRVKFLARGSGYTLFLTPGEAVLSLRKPGREARTGDEAFGTARAKRATRAKPGPYESAVLRMRLVGADPSLEITGLEELPGKSNYLIGRDRSKWSTGVPHYARVRYAQVYPGIDLVFYGTNQRRLEYDFVVAPGADPQAIALNFEGADELEIDEQGDLVVDLGGSEVRLIKPVVYQEEYGARQELQGAYVLRDDNRVGFEVTAYDASRPLVIDPVLVYSTYLGGEFSDFNGIDNGHDIAIDAAGNAYVIGETWTTDFPVTAEASDEICGSTAPPDTDCASQNGDAFVAKLNADGTALVYSTYLGGGGQDIGWGIAVDADRNAYVTGFASAGFPNNAGTCGFSAFVAKLNAVGSDLVYATCLARGSEAYGIAVDADRNAYVTGFGCSSDAFVAKLNADGSEAYFKCLGGSAEDSGEDIAVDGNGNAYVTGYTFSTDFPTVNPLQLEKRARSNTAFVARLDATGATDYATYLGGSGAEIGVGIAVDAFGNAYITGRTHSTDFPTTANAFQQRIAGCKPHSACSDAFVVKLNPEGNLDDFCLDAGGASISCDDPGVAVEIFPYSTYLGGKETDTGWDIAVNASGRAYVTGQTESRDFPTTSNAFDTSCGTDGKCDPNQGFLGNDAFVVQLDADGAALVYSSFLGGSGVDSGRGIAVDDAGGAYVTGWTQSSNFPVLGPGVDDPLQPFLAGIQDAFVAKVSEQPGSGDPPGGCSGFTLTATGYKVKGKQKADLEWCGTAASAVDILRDTTLIADGTVNDGAHTDNIDQKGGGTYIYQICETGPAICSNEATVTF